MSRTSISGENRRNSLQEKLDLEQTKFMQASPLNNVSIVHSSRGLIAIVKLDGSLYVPSSCLSRLVNFDSDEIIGRLEKIGIGLRAKVSIPPNTEGHTMIRSSLLKNDIATSHEEEIPLIPIATAIRILNGTFGSMNFAEEIENSLQSQVQIDREAP